MRHKPIPAATAAVISSALLAFLLVSVAVWAAPNTKIRDSIPDQYKWDLSHVYTNFEDWEVDLARYDSLVEEFAQLEGTIGQSPEALLDAFHLRDAMDRLLDSVYSFASLSSATDQRNNELRAKRQLARSAYSRWQVASSWFEPELLEIGLDKLQSWLTANMQLDEYDFEIESLFRRQEHMLSKEQEQLLSYFSNFNSAPAGIYNALTVADVDHPTITTSEGEEILLTYGNYTSLLSTNRNQADRAMAFETLVDMYRDHANTHATIYEGILQRDWATAQSRGYESTLESYLDRDNVPTEVFENLIATVKKGSGAIQRYYKLKKEYMGLDEYHMYDRFIPIVDHSVTYEYDSITDWVISSVGVLGEHYRSTVESAFQNRWIDVYENEGKSTGGFCSGVYGVHPYILLNYNGTLNEVFTVAHEMGHAMHSVLANETQPYPKAGYSIFVAEVASISNELLLLDYLLERTEDPKERAYLIQHTLDGIRGTFYRQLQFADFEWRAHQMVEKGQPVTSKTLQDLYLNVLSDFYGEAMVQDTSLGYYWSMIPHFHFGPYYVYKYATSYAAASHIVGNILKAEGAERQEAMDRYLTLLKSGGGDYPMELLKEAGVDMSNQETYQAVIDLTDDLVTQLEAELDKL